MADVHALLAPIKHLHERIRGAVVAACESALEKRGLMNQSMLG